MRGRVSSPNDLRGLPQLVHQGLSLGRFFSSCFPAICSHVTDIAPTVLEAVHGLNPLLHAGLSFRRRTEASYNFALSSFRDGAIGEQRRQYAFMPKVLAPSFELLRRPTEPFAYLRQRVPQAVRMIVRQSRGLERLPKNVADWRRVCPMLARQLHMLELSSRTDCRQRFGKQWVVMTP